MKSAQRSDDNVARKTWALEVQSYMNGYRSKATGEGLGFSSKGVLTASVLSFLKFYVDDGLHYDWKLEPSIEEANRKATRKAMSQEDVQALYEASQSSRDKALVLLDANGLSPAEMIQVASSWKKWFPKEPEKLQARHAISAWLEPRNDFRTTSPSGRMLARLSEHSTTNEQEKRERK